MPLILLTPAEKVSRETWNRMKHAKSLEVRLGEETLTDLLLLDLKAHERYYGIKLIQTSKPREAKSGTDLEVVVRYGRRRARIYAIQAKKLHQGRYRSIGRSTRSGDLQIDVLEDYAKRVKAIPCYLLYNYTDSSPCSTGQAASRFWHCCLQCDEPQFGCTLVPSWVIRKAIYKKPADQSFDFVHQHRGIVPWRCLFDCSRIECNGSPCNGMPGDFLSSFKTDEIESSYDWIPFEPVENAWPEQLPSDARDSEDNFIDWYYDRQERDDEYRPRRLLLIDPEARTPPDFPPF